MGLFDKLKPNKNNKDFFEWLDLILKNELNSEIKAINFNLYEDTDNKWSIELVGTFSFDRDNDDWACDEVFAFLASIKDAPERYLEGPVCQSGFKRLS